MQAIKLESLYPRSVEAKLDKLLPKELPLEAWLEINGGYQGLVYAFSIRAGVVDEDFVLSADYHEETSAPDEPDFDEFHTDVSSVQFNIDRSIRDLNSAFGKADVPRRHRMPLMNQMIATTRLEAEM